MNSNNTRKSIKLISNQDITTFEYQNEQQKALAKVIASIRESLDIDIIFKTTVTEVRQLLKADRVGILRFYPNWQWQGEFICEDLALGCQSIIAKKVQDECFSLQFAELYKQGRINVITDIYQSNFSQCFVEILSQFQIRANVAVPLLQGNQLWGLLCVHQCNEPRDWQASEIEFISLIAEHLGLALQHIDLRREVRSQAVAREKAAEWQKTVAITIEKIRQSLDLSTIFQTTTGELRELLNVDRVLIYRFNPDWSGEIMFESVAEGWISLLREQSQRPEFTDNISECSLKNMYALPVVDTYLHDTAGGRFSKNEKYRICNDIYSAGFTNCYLKVLESFQAKAYIIIAIHYKHKLWGLLAVYQNSSSREWHNEEVYLLNQLGTHLGVALHQAELLQKMQIQAADLTKAAERQRGLATTVDKIRQSLDINIIFKITTQEVRRLLEVERVAIYRFYPDWSGEFVADSIDDGWTPVVKPQPLGERHLLQATQAGKYPRNEAFVPISQGEKLWGLLVAYQNSQPRYWQDEEINLLAQVGVQLGVALQQAESLKQVQEQAEKLAKAAQREKALAATVEKIRQSLDLNNIFATSTQEVRRLLEVDRVVIYRFFPDWSGEFVAESVNQGWRPIREIMNMVTDDYLQKIQGWLYVDGKILVIKDIYSNNYSPCHLAFMEQMQAKAYMIVPIFHGEKLWGLLAAYQNNKARNWQEDEVDLLVQIGSQLGVGLQQAELLEQTQRQKEELTETLKELQRTQTQLIQSEKMAGLGQLVAGVAHEINNPINFIFGNITHVEDYTANLLKLLDLYQKHYPHPTTEIQEQAAAVDIDYIADDLPKTLSSMMIGADRIRQLVLSLQNFSRLDHAEIKPVDIHEGIDSALMILQHRLNPKPACAIEVVKEYGNLPLIECYAAQLNQVFMNVLNNAIDAIEESFALAKKKGKKKKEKGQITIRTELLEGNYILIRIADNGCGIPEKLQSRIFDPFFTTKEPGQGTGLGLSISYQIIVEKHGGQFKCFSELGVGSEFWIEIPKER